MELTVANKSGMVSGTTTAAYVKILTIDTRGCGILGKTRFLLANTHATLTMKYKIDGYLADTTGGDAGGQAIALKAETSINAATTVDDITYIVMGYAAVVFSVIDNSGHATYQLDYTTF
jgi:hypothetical protein